MPGVMVDRTSKTRAADMPDAGITRLRFSIAMPYAKTMARVSIAMSNAKTLARVSLIILSTLLLAGCSDTTEEIGRAHV